MNKNRFIRLLITPGTKINVSTAWFFGLYGFFVIFYVLTIVGIYRYHYLHATPARICQIPAIIFGLFYLVSCVVQYCKTGWRGFAGLTPVLLLFLAAVYARILADSYSQYSAHTAHWFTFIFLTVLPILYFSIPIRKNAYVFAFKSLLLVLAILTLIMFVVLSPYIVMGQTIASEEYRIGTASLATNLLGPTSVNRLNYAAPRSICPAVGLLFVLLTWGWGMKRISTSVYIAWGLVSLSIICFSRGVGFLVAVILVCLILTVYLSLTDSIKRSLVFISTVTCLFLVVMIVVGRNDSDRSILAKILNKKDYMTDSMKKVTRQLTDIDSMEKMTRQLTDSERPESSVVLPKKIRENKIAFTMDDIRQALAPEQFESRGFLWIKSFQKILANPLLGYSFEFSAADTAHNRKFLGKRMTPHNCVLSAFMGTGVVGGCLFLCLVYHGFRDSYFLLRRHPALGWLATIWGYTFFISFFDVFFLNNNIAFWVSLVAVRAALVATLGTIPQAESVGVRTKVDVCS